MKPELYLKLLWLGLGFGFLLCMQSIAEDYHSYVQYMTSPDSEILP